MMRSTSTMRSMPLVDSYTAKVQRLSILDVTGKVDPKVDPKLDAEELLRLYRAMAFARELDERAIKWARERHVAYFFPGAGQEAVGCGVGAVLGAQDTFVGSPRDYAARLTRGENVASILRSFSVVPQSGAQQLMRALGLAYARRIAEQPSAVVVMFGEGAALCGAAHELFNQAARGQLPLVMVCVKNGFVGSSRASDHTTAPSVALHAACCGVEAIVIDGNDVLAVVRAAKAASRKVRNGEGPTLIEAETYRLGLSNIEDDPARYRAEQELEQAQKGDPLVRLRKFMVNKKIWSQAQEDELDAQLKLDAEAAIKQAGLVGGEDV